ncbi:MAG: sensor histidine kinase [Niastella sp.]|nr:sensor histidine kinase [Niastella sp.]
MLLKQQSIDLLKQEQSLQTVITEKQQQELAQKEKELGLQQENIDLLHNKEQLQESQLKQANFIKKMTFAGIVLLLVIVGLLYNQYRVKHLNNRAISEKNERLNGLLEEKEWLLKEVHHRVKNNLQVVSSLLQSQSAYLKDEALAAVHDSQHRVQAMSLIHQKLYQTDNISTINMDIYIPELVDYLRDSFVTRTRIVFVMDIEPVALDVTQAIPLGLIINEAVTNVFKHAFTGRERGQVHVSLKQLNEEELILHISDNGIGLQIDPDLFPKSSLGLNLMKGLCRDFNGRYNIESKEGTHIEIIFTKVLPPYRGTSYSS